MNYFLSLFVAVMGNVVAYYVIKWLNRDRDDQ